MFKEKYRIDVIAWLIIILTCVALITLFFISENMILKEENHLLITKEKNNQHTIDLLKTANDSLVNIIGFYEESVKLHEYFSIR
jgi:hypothetical protein